MTKRETQILKNSLSILRKELDPKRIVLFGSRAKGVAGKGSDFDLAVDCREPNSSMTRYLRDKLEEKSGLYHIDLVFLPSVSRDFRNLILHTGKIVYARGN